MSNMQTVSQLPPAIEHPDEPVGNDVRRRLRQVEPKGLRTYTPSLAVLDKSAGWKHWTPEGRTLIDFTSGVLVANLGHNPVRWWKRVTDYMQMSALDSIEDADGFAPMVTLTAYNGVTDVEVQACERLLANMRREPGGGRMEQVLWAASGSEAIQKSLWASMIRRPGQEMLLATRRGFHGKKGLACAVTGSEQDPERDPRVRFLSFPTDACCDIEQRKQPLDLAPYEAELERLWDDLGERICCVITEPYLGGGGSFHPQPEYLQLLERFCRDHDIIFILDEIQSNFGRTGPMYAYTHYGLEPDIVCLGKGMGNGVPVSAAVGRADVLGLLNFGEASDTWSANPLASAAVLATLDEFESTDVLERGQRLSQTIESGLSRLKDTGVVANIRGEGTVWGIECCEVGSRSANEVANACVETCYRGDDGGYAIHLLGPLSGKVIRISPPLVTPIDEAERAFGVMFELFQKLAKQLN
jgi:4-aminobutyrate aminotransferase-like enzyme